METPDSCHSDSSSVSVTSQEPPAKASSSGDLKMKAKIEQKRPPTTMHLDLKLFSVESMDDRVKENPSRELNLFNSSAASESSNDGFQKPSAESKTFTCSFCKREFSTSQALGGHQNAHKQERAMAKHRHGVAEMAAAAGGAPPPFVNPYYPYSNYGQIPFYSSSLGVRAEALIHKRNSYTDSWPSRSPYGHGHRHGQERLLGAYLMNQQSYERLRVEKLLNERLNSPILDLGIAKVDVYAETNDEKSSVKEEEKSYKRLQVWSLNSDLNEEDDSGLDLNLKL